MNVPDQRGEKRDGAESQPVPVALLIAYHFPPVGFSSGVQRALSLARYLPAFGWRPVVLTVSPRAYPETNEAQTADIPPEVRVYRAQTLDTKRHLSFLGRYPGRLAVPDRWISWSLGARLLAGRLVARERPDLVWSTYPIATAHHIGRYFAQRFRLPWVADFRDSMTEANYPKDPDVRRRFLAIEEAAVHQARLCTFTAPGTVAMYQARYPEAAARFRRMPNGYDEEIIRDVEARLPAGGKPGDPRQPLTLVHSGTLYPSERDPTAFLDALAILKQAGRLSAGDLRVVLRATAHDALVNQLIAERGLQDLVATAPPLDYRGALEEMQRADGLLIFQAGNCNHQIPAKLYEYLRCGRPVLALTDPDGDTASTLRESGAGVVVPLDDAARIADALPEFIASIRNSSATDADPDWIARHSRQQLAGQTAQLFAEALRRKR